MYRQNRNKKYLENLGQEENYCLTVDCYPGVDDEIFDLIKEIYKPDFVIKSEDVFYEKDELNKMMNPFLTENRGRGVVYADKHKMDIFENIDYFLDSNQEGNPKIVTGNALRSALKKTTQRPFRLVPYFDPGVWGGQWMKKNCDLDEKQNNYAWSFDGVPEENSLYFRFGDTRIEIPAMD